MTITVEAIYEQGVLRPIQPLSLAEGTRVEIIVITQEPTAEGRTPADILAAIAALPMEIASEEFSGRDHDKILYLLPHTSRHLAELADLPPIFR